MKAVIGPPLPPETARARPGLDERPSVNVDGSCHTRTSTAPEPWHAAHSIAAARALLTGIRGLHRMPSSEVDDEGRAVMGSVVAVALPPTVDSPASPSGESRRCCRPCRCGTG